MKELEDVYKREDDAVLNLLSALAEYYNYELQVRELCQLLFSNAQTLFYFCLKECNMLKESFLHLKTLVLFVFITLALDVN